MNRITIIAATVIAVIATLATLSFTSGRQESMTLAREQREAAGGPPPMSPFKAMQEHARNLPLEDWGPPY
jgi:hypothetical protein